MPILIKVSKHGTGHLRFCVPKHISTKYNWSKNTSFMLYVYEDKIIVLEPTDDFKTTSTYSSDHNNGDKVFYRNPCVGYKVFSFYLPKAITEKLHLQNVKFFAVHESGDKAVFLEAFKNGTEKR